MKSYSQIDLIKESRWEMAFFTTYALSLTFFETYIFPHLRKSGCEKIIILVDADGYHSSLMELKSRHVGQEYLLIPVRLKGGIFHPKISYLCGPDGDLLMVGSGNLTFGGHGKNVESLEILNPKDDGAAFGDFAEFIDKLISDERISFRRVDELKVFKRRAEKSSELKKELISTRLIHTLDGAISEQLIKYAKDIKGWEELLILSPFHHPQGIPIKELANSLGISKLLVGVPSNTDDTSSFPFSLVESWGMNFHVISPKVENPKRPLHAKWIEVRGKENWSLVGSINGTAQSLMTTKNVEVGVLRFLNESSHLNWKKAKEPTFQKDQFLPGDSDSITTLVLDAQLNSEGQINGHILGFDAPAQEWQGFLEGSDNLVAQELIPVDRNGFFKWTLNSFSEFENVGALQIRLEKDGLIARGWLGIESFLKLPSRSRSAINALSRMLDRSESLDDIHALLDFIAMHAGRMITISSTISSSSNSPATKVVDDFLFSSSELSEDGFESETHLFRHLAHSSADEDRSWHVIQTIAKLLLGKRLINSTQHKPKFPTSNTLSLVEDEHDAQVLEKTTDAIEEFNRHVRFQLDQLKIGESKVSQLLFVWLSVNLDMYLRRIQDRNSAFSIASEWMRRVSKTVIPTGERALLDECIYGISASLAWHVDDTDITAQKVYGISLSKSLIHQWLESYCGGSVDEDFALSKARLWFTHETGMLLVNNQSVEALNALFSTLKAATIRGALELIISTHIAGDLPIIPADIFSQDEEAMLRIAIKSPPNKPAYRLVNHHNITGCPKCYQSLIKDSQIQLSARRLTQCMGMSCRALLISLGA